MEKWFKWGWLRVFSPPWSLVAATVAEKERRCDMTPLESKEVADLVQRVPDWPPPIRIPLARRILETLESPRAQQPPNLPRGPSSAEVGAMFSAQKPAPNDEEIGRILEEELLKKYGP
jgi:hypothetical protein